MSTSAFIAGTSLVRARRTITDTPEPYRPVDVVPSAGEPVQLRVLPYPAAPVDWRDVSEAGRRVALVTLGCARNEVDSEELAARLGDGEWELSDTDDAEIVVVNTCGFVDAA